jgi:IclR family acetate operon transcriptional repressor
MPRGPAAANSRGTELDLADVNGSKTVASVERAADILLHFAHTDRPDLGVTDIANDLGLSKAAVHRLLSSLRTRNLVSLDPNTRRYSLGASALMLGLSALHGLDVRRLASAELPAISRDTSETATLSIRSNDVRIYVEQVTPPREVIMSVSIGRAYPLHAGSSSKAFLAFMEPQEIEHFLSQSLPKLTDDTVTDRRVLAKELRQIAARGWAQSINDRQAGAASVAAPVLDHSGRPVAVLSVCGPAERFAPEAAACAERLLVSTHKLSAQLGYRR